MFTLRCTTLAPHTCPLAFCTIPIFPLLIPRIYFISPSFFTCRQHVFIMCVHSLDAAVCIYIYMHTCID